jgi:bisphosphoglycerate-independent phosphoglycerate mutase (AlkP superfamily)
VAAFDTSGGAHPNAQQLLINRMLRDSYKPWEEGECFDVFTHHAAFEELKKSQPRILYVAYGETDEWAHAGKYRSYLDAAHQVDAWIKELWDYVQSHPQYRNKTALLITTDHGRGDTIKEQWTDHGSKIEGANEIWLALMAPGIAAKGEAGTHGMLYQQQIAQTIARLLGQKFTASHPVAESISPVFDK